MTLASKRMYWLRSSFESTYPWPAEVARFLGFIVLHKHFGHGQLLFDRCAVVSSTQLAELTGVHQVQLIGVKQ